jgi:hypothetical protein
MTSKRCLGPNVSFKRPHYLHAESFESTAIATSMKGFAPPAHCRHLA